MGAVKQAGYALEYASPSLQNDKEVVMVAVWGYPMALEYASPSLQNDKYVVLAAVKHGGRALQYASPPVQNDKDVVLVAVKKNRDALEYASLGLRNDKDFILQVVRIYGCGLQYASTDLQNDKDVVLVAVKKDCGAVQFASPSLQSDKQVVMNALQGLDALQNENALRKESILDKNVLQKYIIPCDVFKNASPSLRRDKEIALISVKQDPDNIKYISDNDLKRDPDILIAAGMFDSDHDDADVRKQKQTDDNSSDDDTISSKITLSTRFDLDQGIESQALKFTRLLKQYIIRLREKMNMRNFTIYAPNAFDKKTCDPQWTNFYHPCRGTEETCNGWLDEAGRRKANVLTKNGYPTDNCCWRYSFRSQLEEAKDTGGFMIQLIESTQRDGKVKDAKLGDGQRIELDMANTIGTKVFQVYRPEIGGEERGFDKYKLFFVLGKIYEWYDNQCQDMSVTVIHPRSY